MRIVVWLSAVMVVATAAAQAAPTRGTLTGVVTRGPISPICIAEQPCSEPANGVTLVFSRGAAVSARVVTDGNGRYHVRLRAGRYHVRRPGGTTLGWKVEPNDVRVLAGRVVRVDFSIDTGIR